MKQREIKSNIPYLRGGGVMIETEFVVSAHSAKHHTLCCHKHRTLGDSVSQHQLMRVFFATHPQQTNFTRLRKGKNFFFI